MGRALVHGLPNGSDYDQLFSNEGIATMPHRVSILLIALLFAFADRRALAKETAQPESPSAALQDYVKKPDSSYGWTKRRAGKLGQGTYVELTLTSQTWRGIVWKHQLFIYRPANVASAADAMLLISGGRWDEALAKPPAADEVEFPAEFRFVTQLADQMRAPVAVVRQVPQQPIFDGMFEDQIISFTFSKFYQTGDAEWPLLLPMVKSAVRAMDAVEEFTAQEWDVDVERFLVTGASKRGWTTWLTAAVDPRVNALAPMVINMLNMEPHMKLQQASFGGYSEQIHDYTERGLHNQLGSERGIALRAIVDPYSYRRKLPQPKLIILGTNDRYWPVDSLNLYWDALEGEKYILYVPNNGHDVHDYPRVFGSVVALHNSVAGGKPLPKLEWDFADQGERVCLRLSIDAEPTEVVAWTAAAKSRDFRDAVWQSEAVETGGGAGHVYEIAVQRTSDGFTAVFAEAKFPAKSMPFYLSTGLRVIAPGGKPEVATGL